MIKTEDLLKRYDAQFVGGDAIGIVDGKHTVLAKNTRDGVVLTEAGHLIAAQISPLDLDAYDGAGGSKPGKRTRKLKDGEPRVAGEGLTDPENPPAGDGVEDAPEGAQLSLELADTAGISEQFGGED